MEIEKALQFGWLLPLTSGSDIITPPLLLPASVKGDVWLCARDGAGCAIEWHVLAVVE
jgi:hypothetical protein